ncbi:MAG: formylglycine-generating enzyme family protein, partial [Spirochaetaceae bacterium]|nr:formylglycine-generating enzyme family protein [Spirochaetaceae bacterium]
RGGEASTDKAVWAGTTIESGLGKYAWYINSSDNRTHEVKKKLPNGYGLYDMSGNVFEWCWDWYGGYTEGDATDPAGASSGSDRVLRGGSWTLSSDCRASYRNANSPEVRLNGVLGFRLVRTVK